MMQCISLELLVYCYSVSYSLPLLHMTLNCICPQNGFQVSAAMCGVVLKVNTIHCIIYNLLFITIIRDLNTDNIKHTVIQKIFTQIHILLLTLIYLVSAYFCSNYIRSYNNKEIILIEDPQTFHLLSDPRNSAAAFNHVLFFWIMNMRLHTYAVHYHQ